MTIIAFDYGTKNIGVAVGQTIIKIAHALKVIKNKKQDGQINWLLLGQLINTWKPKKMIVGLPLNMDGSTQYITTLTKKFAYNLNNKFNIHVELYDERLSTVEAKNMIFSDGGWKKLYKYDIDAISASIILQSWFNAR
ncbi:Holliday junction resolvase RuvX [Enterobacteriaceae endosymbiont of Macroplea mutica]|uniref:Holliday junction resolvase RuvX n=1 Tax=Enterobacteriaceae endosymbiont of Macroplea mutica TaxID=2675791 RepID=UPI0014495D93|nr:Holliday junction resolvase RuvX [Enterobacteriaceae endosymbiont of Macroplea mutica]QJC31301.1 Holliday junction resolvase RuvX [Enterobacteriaceae endosymbiont of Macroplea mutica]